MSDTANPSFTTRNGRGEAYDITIEVDLRDVALRLATKAHLAGRSEATAMSGGVRVICVKAVA